nr:outer envelope pore protein 21B, chloroplastic isoform X3 [Solanum lycopersicum]
MESSLRYAGDSKSLVIHAKEKFPLNTFTHLQGHAELDTKIGAPTYLCAMIRQYFPDKKSRVAAEFTWDIMDVKKDQDVRLKVGYEVIEKVPYFHEKSKLYYPANNKIKLLKLSNILLLIIGVSFNEVRTFLLCFCTCHFHYWVMVYTSSFFMYFLFLTILLV